MPIHFLCAINTDLTPLPVPPPTDKAGEGWGSARFVNMSVDRCTTATPIMGPADSSNILWGECAGCNLGTAQIGLFFCTEANVDLNQLACGLDLLLCIMFHKSREILSFLSALELMW